MHRSGRRAAFILGLAIISGAVPGIATAQTEWRPIGPAPINGPFSGGVTGRASVIAVNPFNGQQVWLGTASGGVWFTPDGGQSWQPLSDKVASLAVGAIRLADCDANGCATLYVGTGENAIRRDTYYGAGLLIGTRFTTDPLAYNWQQRDGTPNFDFRGGSIVDIAVHTGTSGANTILWIALSSGVTMSSSQATVTAPEPLGGYGLYKSTDQGTTWSKLTVNQSAAALPTSLRIDPQNNNTLYAGFFGRGVFRSTNGGATWCPMNPGLDGGMSCAAGVDLPDPTQVTFDHVEVVPTLNSYMPGSPTYLYATFGFCPDWRFGECKPSMYKSTDQGASWQHRRVGDTGGSSTYPPPCGYSYSRYTHGLTVHPFDHSTVYMAGLSLCRSGASGGLAVEAHDNAVPGSGPWNWGNVIHLDHHAIAFDPTNATHRYSTSDGGFAEQTSATGIFAWTPRNDGLQITGFQTITTSPLTESVFGASQDNGGHLWTGGLAWDWKPCCGDGGYAVMDAENAQVMYATQNYGSMGMSTDGGTTWTPPFATVGPSDSWTAFYAPLIQGPGPTHGLFYGGSRLWWTDNDNLSWVAVSPVLSHSVQPEIDGEFDVISAIAVAPGNENRIYVGYYGGGIWTTNSASDDCNDIDPPAPVCNDPADWVPANAGLPAVPVTGIAVSAVNEMHAWVTLSGFGNHARVWETTDAGQSWLPFDSGLPAGVPANTIAVDHDTSGSLLVGLDGNATGATLWRRVSGASSWVGHSQGLPNAPVMSIAVDMTRNRAYVATHGRGAFIRGPSFVMIDVAWVEEVLWEIPIWGWQFEPEVDCTIQILEVDGTTCADSPVDALGGTLRTNSEGRLTASRAGFSNELPLVWGCFGGQCAGGVDTSSCEVDRVQVSCGADSASTALRGVQTMTAPPSALMRTGVPTAGAAGGTRGAADGSSFDLVASLQSGDGTTRSLCSVGVEIGNDDLPSDVLDTAKAALEGSPVCGEGGVQVALHGGTPTFEEDAFGAGPWLQLKAPGLTGTQLLTAIHAAPGTATDRCFELRALGLPLLDQLHVLSLELETEGSGAAGGEITVVETSGLGTCAVTVTTETGQAPDDIAGLIQQAFQAPGVPGPNPHCPSRRNPRDVSAVGEIVHVIAASTLEVCVNDPGVGFFLKSEDLGNVHPIAACTDTVVECTSPAGAMVMLDGAGSRDPDSTPGTNDLVAHEWYLDYGMASSVFLGSGEQLAAQLALGTHEVTLVVRDAAGLTGVQTCAVNVVDTTAPSLTATVDPALLWPPNHRLVDVIATVQSTDLCSVPAIDLVSLSSTEPDDAPGPADGETTGDIAEAAIGTDDRVYRLRAERHAAGTGREYTIEYRAIDGGGNATTVHPVASVPLDVGGVVEPILLNASQTEAGTVLSWTPAGDDSRYNVISGDLAGITDTGNAYDLGSVVSIEDRSEDTTTAGHEDERIPAVGRAFFYLVEYEDGSGLGSGYGTESASKPRIAE